MDNNQSKPTLLHFAHANGFPAGSYNKLFSYLPNSMPVIAIDKLAHNPDYPLVDSWQHQVTELIDYVEANRPTKDTKVIAVGHSFGSVVSYMAACTRPDLFCGLIMLDPPLVTGFMSLALKFIKSTSYIYKFTPAGITKLRARKWHKNTRLEEYFASKALFKNFDSDCIRDYVASATELRDDHHHLTYNVDVEVDTFTSMPHNLSKFSNKLECPAVLLTGKHSDVCAPYLFKPFLKKNPTMVHEEFPYGGHMFPLEYPVELAKKLSELALQHGMLQD